MTARTHEQFLIDLEYRQPSVFKQYTILGHYISNHVKIEVKCNNCNTITMKTPSKLLTGRGCNECRKLSICEIKERLNKVHPTYFVECDSVTSVRDEVIYTCANGHKNSTKLHKLLEGHGCKKCSDFNLRKEQNLIDKLKTLQGITWVAGEYVNCKTSLVFSCQRHGLFTSTADTIINKKRSCPLCSRDKLRFHNTTIAERNKDTYALTPTVLYLIYIESLGYKIGISKNPTSRFKTIKRESGCDISVVKQFNTNLYDAILLENSILNNFKRKDFDIVFAGYTEVIDAPLEDILNFIETRII